MTQKWLDNSQLVVGLLIEHRLSPDAFIPEVFFPPYSEVVTDIKKGSSLEELQLKHSIGLIQSCCSATSRVNGLGEKTDWMGMLLGLSSTYQAGALFEKAGRKMQEGREVDIPSLKNALNSLSSGSAYTLTPLKDITPRKYKTIPLGWQDIDEYFGGIPAAGVLEIIGSPKVGKTTLACKVSGIFAKRYPKKKVLFYTLEMLDEELAQRYFEIFDEEPHANLYVDCKRHNVYDIVAGISAIEDLGLVVIDYAEKLIEGETTESKMAEVFRELAFAAKSLKVPIILMASFSRSYAGGLPRPNQVRYTGSSEYEVYGCWALYNPNNDYFAKDKEAKKTLPAVEGKAYILGWFVRGGFPTVKGNAGPRAIQLPYEPALGWGEGGRVFSLKGYD